MDADPAPGPIPYSKTHPVCSGRLSAGGYRGGATAHLAVCVKGGLLMPANPLSSLKTSQTPSADPGFSAWCRGGPWLSLQGLSGMAPWGMDRTAAGTHGVLAAR